MQFQRKKSKLIPDKLQSKQYFENCLEATPNVSLNVHSSEFPDIDLDTFDILKDSNFPMSINEQELDSVLNSCCPPPPLAAAAVPPNANDHQFSSQMSSDQLYSYKSSSTQPPIEPVASIMSTKKFKIEETVANTPLFPPAEIPINSSRLSSSVSVDYGPLGYLPPSNNSITNSNNGSYAPSIVPAVSDSMKYYSLNLAAPPMSTQQNSAAAAAAASPYSYLPYSGGRNPMAPDIVPTNHNHSSISTSNNNSNSASSQQYFYQYVNFPTASDIIGYSDMPSNGAVANGNFQLPAMSTGWYNTPAAAPALQQTAKQAACKQSLQSQQQQQQQQQFLNMPPTTSSNYLHNFPHYPVDNNGINVNGNSNNSGHPILCQPVQFNGHYDATAFAGVHHGNHHSNSSNNNGNSNNGNGIISSNNNSGSGSSNSQQQHSYNSLMGQPNLASYNIPPDQNSYYYVDYCNVASIANRNGNRNGNNGINGLNVIGQNESQFMANHGGGNLCRNVYPSHCI